jgi:hypothetical protein
MQFGRLQVKNGGVYFFGARRHVETVFSRRQAIEQLPPGRDL